MHLFCQWLGGGGEAALINLGHAQAATACCHTPSRGAQHLHRDDNASGIRTRAWINSEQNAWLAAEASETEVLGILQKEKKWRKGVIHSIFKFMSIE